tara:strand:- start:14319 stop:17615 length:3297 start_codon:yes stop_codon:yes gene_type:complete
MNKIKIFRNIAGIFWIFIYLNAQSWVEINSSEPKESNWVLNSLSNNTTQILFELPGFYMVDIKDNKKSINFPDGAPILESGYPDLPQVARSIIIPDLANMSMEVVKSEFIDIQDMDIISSKGNLYRDVSISSVPYSYSEVYEKDLFYPEKIAFLRDPYILGSVRGQTIVIRPIQYNPISNTLRVYTKIELKIEEDGVSTINPLVQYPSKNIINRSHHFIYEDHFLNYSSTAVRYDPLSELGKMLVICHGPFINAMSPFIEWKNIKGVPTEIIDVNDIGGNSDEIKEFVENYYYQESLVFLLLVGDIEHIPSPRFSLGNGSNSPADASYGFIAGDDFYPEVFVGRFSAEDTIHVNTMVSRTIAYERYPDSDGEWFKKGSGFASNQGPGDDGEYDDDHLDIIRQKLLDYNYVEIDQVYDPTGTVSQGESAINEGRSIINYTGHGSNSGWGNGCPMNNTDVNSLVNTGGKWPFIWTVACVTGEFHVGTCFAETWLRATHNDEPSGAIAKFASTVNAAWNPPMDAQDEMNSIFVESYENNTKRTFGGLSLNGCMEMNDNYGTAGYHETLFWTIFGDPSVVVRSDIPQELDVNFESILIIGETEYSLNTGIQGANVAISMDGELVGGAISDGNGNALVVFENPIEVPGELLLVVTAYNAIPFEASIDAIAPEGPYVLLEEFNVYSSGWSGESSNLNFGEAGYIMVNINNSGNENANNLILNLYNLDGLVSLDVSSFELDSLLPGQDSLVGPFQFQIGINIDDQQEINFTLEASSGEQSWSQEIDISANAPNFGVVSLNFDNLSLDPGDSDSINISIENIGHASLAFPDFSLSTGDPNFTINEGVTSIGDVSSWDIASQISINFLLTAEGDLLPGYTGLVNLNISSLENSLYQFNLPIPITVGLMVEDFENGNFNSFNWLHEGSSDWFVTSVESYQGDFAARSGEIGNSEFTTIKIEKNLPYSGELSFRAKISSQSGDALAFFVNGVQYGPNLTGILDWTEYSFEIDAGEKIFSWVYMKDQFGTVGEDMAMLDWITFPAGAQPHIDYGDLNQDSNINVLDVILTVASIIGQLVLEENQILAADMNFDGVVDVFDVMLIVDSAFQ